MTNSKTLTNFETKLFNACVWNQENDRNGSFMEMWEEYLEGELPLEIVVEVLENVFTDIRDEQSAPDDTKQIAEMNQWLEYIKEEEATEISTLTVTELDTTHVHVLPSGEELHMKVFIHNEEYVAEALHMYKGKCEASVMFGHNATTAELMEEIAFEELGINIVIDIQ